MVVEFLEGNEAIARGALAAGCDFFAGYPITPASSILHYLLDWLPRTGGIAIQAEDEIASMGLCIGAATAGRRACTATSGPGISLYSENLGLAIIGETPLVIIDVQRQGPATGSATKGADSDVQFVRWGTSGGLPIVAFAPSGAEDAYALTYRAFNVAERLRVPVFVLANKELGVTKERVDLDAVPLPPRESRPRVAQGAVDFAPHGFADPRDVPHTAPIGEEHIVRFTTSTHDERGMLTTDPETIGRMIEHYRAKIETRVEELTFYERYGDRDVETLVVAYGVTARAARIAVQKARKEGAPVALLELQTLWPVPEPLLRRELAGVARVVVPEMNLGQYRREIERVAPADVEIVGIEKMNGELLAADEILARGALA